LPRVAKRQTDKQRRLYNLLGEGDKQVKSCGILADHYCENVAVISTILYLRQMIHCVNIFTSAKEVM